MTRLQCNNILFNNLLYSAFKSSINENILPLFFSIYDSNNIYIFLICRRFYLANRLFQKVYWTLFCVNGKKDISHLLCKCPWCYCLFSSLRPTLKRRCSPRHSWETASSSTRDMIWRTCWVTRLWYWDTLGPRRTSRRGAARKPKDWTLGRRGQWRSSRSSLSTRGWSGTRRMGRWLGPIWEKLWCTWLQQNIPVTIDCNTFPI